MTSLLQIDTPLDDDGLAAEVAGLERSMLTRAALSVVVVTNHNPANALGLVVAADIYAWHK